MKVKESCISALKSNLSIVRPVHAVSSKFSSNWDASSLTNALMQARMQAGIIQKKKKSSKNKMKNTIGKIALSLSPTSIGT